MYYGCHPKNLQWSLLCSCPVTVSRDKWGHCSLHHNPCRVLYVVGRHTGLTWTTNSSTYRSRRIGNVLDGSKPSPKRSSWERIRLLSRRERVSNILDYDKNVSSIENKNLKRHKILTNKSEQHQTKRVYIFFPPSIPVCDLYIHFHVSQFADIYISGDGYGMSSSTLRSGTPFSPYFYVEHSAVFHIVSTPYPVTSRVHRCFRGFCACNLSTMLGRSWWRIPIVTVQVCVEVCVFRCTVVLLRHFWSSAYLLRILGVSTPWVWQVHMYHVYY